LHAATGERSLALRQFEICRGRLSRDLGVAPDRATIALYERLAESTPVTTAESVGAPSIATRV